MSDKEKGKMMKQELECAAIGNVILETFELEDGRLIILEQLQGFAKYYQVRTGDSWVCGVHHSGFSLSYVRKCFKKLCKERALQAAARV